MNSRSRRNRVDNDWSSSTNGDTWTSPKGWNDSNDAWNSTSTRETDTSWGEKTGWDSNDSWGSNANKNSGNPWNSGSDGWDTSSTKLTSTDGWGQTTPSSGRKRTSHHISDINPRILAGAGLTVLIIAVIILIVKNADTLSAFFDRLISALASSAAVALIIVAIVFLVLKAVGLSLPWKAVVVIYVIAFLSLLFGDYIPGLNAILRMILTIVIVIGLFCFMFGIGSKK